MGSGISPCGYHPLPTGGVHQIRGFWAFGCCFFITLSFACSTYTYRFHISLLPLKYSQIAFLLFRFIMPPLFFFSQSSPRRLSIVHSLLFLRIQALVLCDGSRISYSATQSTTVHSLCTPNLCQVHLIRHTVLATFFLFEITDSTTHTANCAC